MKSDGGRRTICDDCCWCDEGDCMCFHDRPPRDCPDFELRDDYDEEDE